MAKLPLVIVCALTTACASASPDAGAGVGACQVVLEWGVGGPGAFTALPTDGSASVSTDPRGLPCIDSTLRLSGALADTAVITATTTAEGYEPAVLETGAVSLAKGADGALYAEGLELSLASVAPADLAGRRTTVMLLARVGGCEAWTTSTVTLAPSAGASP
jgi:hypothetical protein